MRYFKIISILILALLLSSVSADHCPHFTDLEGNCVDKCKYPQVGDVETQDCLYSQNKCTGILISELNICVQQCPDFFSAQPVKGKTYKTCVACFFKDSKGNCYEKCPSNLIQDFTTGKCLDKSSDCKAYYVNELCTCQKECPKNFIADNSKSPKICVNCKLAGNCGSNNDNNGNTNIMQCHAKLSANLEQCGSLCPPGQYPLDQVEGQTYQLCKQCSNDQPYVNYEGNSCVKECEDSQLIDKKSLNCIEEEQCKTAILKDDAELRWCIKQCPENYAQQVIDGKKYLKCIQCFEGQFIDSTTKQCIDKCDITDASGKICIGNLNNCKGYISQDKTKCQKSCASDEFIRRSEDDGRFFCLSKCDDNEFILEKVGENNSKQLFCVNKCPEYSFADSNRKCISLKDCTTFISIDEKQCLEACQSGQYPIENDKDNLKAKLCKPCLKKLSSDGKSCNKDCAKDELYNVEKQQCEAKDKCNGIVSLNQKLCLQKCKPGQLLFVDANNIKNCIKQKDCKQKISSDRQLCSDHCNENEAPVLHDKQSFCVFCPKGVSADKNSCLKDCVDGQAYDILAKKCINKGDCKGMITVNGKRCVDKCQYPEVKSSASSTQCQNGCAQDELFSNEIGCIKASDCAGYKSSSGMFCVDSCDSILEIIDNDQSSPKTCKRCEEGQYPLIQQDKSVQCLEKSSDPQEKCKKQSDNIKNVLKGIKNISPEEKEQIKNQLHDLSKDLKDSIKEAKSDGSISKGELQSFLQKLISGVQEAAKAFIDAIQSKDASSNVDDKNENKPDGNQLVLGSDEISIIAEKKKHGFAFKLKFNLKDLLTNPQPELQQDMSQDPSSTNTSTSGGSSDTSSSGGSSTSGGSSDTSNTGGSSTSGESSNTSSTGGSSTSGGTTDANTPSGEANTSNTGGSTDTTNAGGQTDTSNTGGSTNSSGSTNQQNPSSQDSTSSGPNTPDGQGDATGQTDPNIQTLQTTNQTTNPYCSDADCSLSGLFSILAGPTPGSGRLLSSNASPTFQLTYDVDPKKIKQTICVSYDTSSGEMFISGTSIDYSKNQITCTFQNNSALYYDSTCKYIDTYLCTSSPSNSSSAKNSSQDEPSNSLILSTSTVIVLTLGLLF